MFGFEVFGIESEVGIVYYKFRVVYLVFKGDDIKKGKFNVDILVKDDLVKYLFGFVKIVVCLFFNGFVKFFWIFVYFKEKGWGWFKEVILFEFWFLIKVVCVFIRFEILKSGFVFVDLVSFFLCLIMMVIFW